MCLIARLAHRFLVSFQQNGFQDTDHTRFDEGREGRRLGLGHTASLIIFFSCFACSFNDKGEALHIDTNAKCQVHHRLVP